MSDKEFLAAALAEAKLGRSEGGVPVGASLAVETGPNGQRDSARRNGLP
jgi:tRNA(Arg) A34 adenosine deaminase TadA